MIAHLIIENITVHKKETIIQHYDFMRSNYAYIHKCRGEILLIATSTSFIEISNQDLKYT